jgi:two-component system chemotaxis sensor kinase CheA
MEELFASLIKDFVEETGPLAREVASLVLRQEEAHANGEDDRQVLRAMKSALHTIKGNAGMMGLPAIESLAHALEDYCVFVSQHSEARRSGKAQILVDGADLLVVSIHRSLHGEADRVAVAALLERVAQAMETAPEATPLVSARQPMSADLDQPGIADQEADKPVSALALAEEDGGGSAVRIADSQVDGLLDLTAEALISHAELVRFHGRLARGHVQASDAALLEQVLATLGRATTEMRHTLLGVRLAPISVMFRRYARYVRDLARERGQAIQLIIEGGQTALDRAIISRLHEPLVHMVRNSVAHGIESAEARAAAGKPVRAQILLGARFAEGRARIVVADDGRGLDLAAIAAKARSIGLCPERMAEADLRRLIFQPGFSTASEVSTLAGRGVGLEVVANVVQSLGGHIDVRTVAGQGTVFVIDLPVTAALVKALIFYVAGEMFAVPASFVADSIEVRGASMYEINHVLLCPWRGDFLRALDAGCLLGCAQAVPACTRPYGIIVEAASKRCALLVDRLVGVQEIVVKPLDETLRGSRVLSGLTVLGQGRVVPILDCGEVLRRVSPPRALSIGEAHGSASHAV